MTKNSMLDAINKKISGLCTLVLEDSEYCKGFTNRRIYVSELYRVDYPEGTRVFLQKFEQSNPDIIEADIIEFLFDILISERYKDWKNYRLIEENVKWLKEFFLK